MKKIITLIVIFLFTCVSVFATEMKQDTTLTSTVQFVVNTNTIIRNENYDVFINDIVPFIQTNRNSVDKILLVGSASPEGSVSNNIKLANRRADRIYSYIKDYVPRNKISINNDYQLFLEKTGLDENDYTMLRATYIEIQMVKEEQEEKIVDIQRDTIYLDRVDTVRYETTNNYYYYTQSLIQEKHNKPIISVYNDLLSDLMFRMNIGTEVYFKKMSFFIEGSFSNWDLVGKTYNIDIWHTGFRKYFNDDYDKLYIEAYANGGYFDTDLFFDIGKIGILYGGGVGVGYVFDMCPHWKICPVIRIGLFERIYYADYYYVENGNINVSFGNYNNGKIDNIDNSNQENNSQKVINISKTITKEFFENSNKAHYFGPTYIGIVIKRDFCIKNKK